jgi:hypothetical protein
MEDVEAIINDAKEHDHDAGVTSVPEEDTHQLDIDDYQPDDLEPSDDSLKTEDTEAEGELIDVEPKAEDQPPFHEHPRWQEMLKERDGLQEQVTTLTEGQQTRLDALEQRLNQQQQYYEGELARWRVPPEQTREPEKDPFSDIMTKPESEIVEQFQEDPRGFLTTFGESITRQVMSQVETRNQELDQDRALQSGLQSFAATNEDFMPMVESGRVAQFIQMNPFHNAISAYHELKAHDASATADSDKEALEKTIRDDERKKTLASIRAKQGAEVLDGSHSATPASGAGTAVEPELQETTKHGGKRNVITSRLKRLRARLT